MRRKDKQEISYKSYTTYRDLPESWGKLSPTCFLHTQHVCLAEMSNLPDLEYRYVEVYYRNNLVAYMYFQLIAVKPKHFKFQSASWQNFARGAMRTLKPRLLVCGHLFRHEIRTVQFLDASFSDYQQAKIIYHVASQLLKQCGTTALLLKDLPSNYDAYFLHHAENCKAMSEDISMQMIIGDDWYSLDDYLTALKHKYKQRAKKILRKAENLYTRELSLQDLDTYADDISRYYADLLEKQLVKLGYINLDYIRNLMETNSDFKFYGIFDEEDTFLGYFSFFDKVETLYMYYVGYDMTLNKEYNLYFNILYWGLELAIEKRKKTLNMGRTALDPKASIGGVPLYSQNYYRIKSNILNRISQRGQSRFLAAQGEVWDIRRPFNTEYYTKSKTQELV